MSVLICLGVWFVVIELWWVWCGLLGVIMEVVCFIS